MNEYLYFNRFKEDRDYRLTLPKCAPIEFGISWTGVTNKYRYIRVHQAKSIRFEPETDEWIIDETTTQLPSADNLDEAIALAAEHGKNYWEMYAQAEHHNAEELRPEPPKPPEQPKLEHDADPIQSAAKLLNKLAHDNAEYGQHTVVIASTLLAIAVEIRRLTNTINDLADNDQKLAESVRIWGNE